MLDGRVCPICGGNGASISRSDRLCSACDGSGWLPDYDPDTVEIPY